MEFLFKSNSIFSSGSRQCFVLFFKIVFYVIEFHAFPFQRRYLEMTDLLSCSSSGGSFWLMT